MSKNPRYNLPIDAIITIPPPNPLAFAVAKMGFLVGSHSSVKALVKDRERWSWAFGLAFIDCEFKKYNHQKHLVAIKANNPQYATVRDLMTKEQCEKDDIEYFDFDTIMKQAEQIEQYTDNVIVEQIEQYTDNVIVIPKFNCLSDIPDKYILGYSIPTKYAGTPLPRELFRGRRVHLLGGSWKKQKEYIEYFDGDVVSFDNNNLWKVSVYGNFDWPNGDKGNLKDCGLDKVSSPMYTSVVISLGHIATELHRMFQTEATKPKNNNQNFNLALPGMEDTK
jgi:hypothetical protein